MSVVASSLVRGCRDIFGRSASHRRHLVDTFAALCSVYNFHEIETPILERAELFSQSLGTNSDVISSEMYHISGIQPALALRPEGTAGVARALRDVGLVKCAPVHGTRVWYAGPMFRHERPQKGRYRQFWQIGVEAIGDESLTTDLDTISLAAEYLCSIRCSIKLRLNTLGNKETRNAYNDALKQFLKSRYWALSALSRSRYDSGNCMRILDSKLPEDCDVMSTAPQLRDFVDELEKERFQELRNLLEEAKIPFVLDNQLVRGLDYYTSTAFEFVGPEGKAVCGGGRYTNVCGASGIGFAIGLDRIEREQCEGIASYERNLEGGTVIIGLSTNAERSTCEIGRAARKLVKEFRERGIKSVCRLDGGRLSKMVGRAARSGAKAVIVVGQQDVDQGTAQVKFVSSTTEQDALQMRLVDVVDAVCASSHGAGESTDEGDGQNVSNAMPR
ncbi:unnamed protein product [Agarophyton chilense]